MTRIISSPQRDILPFRSTFNLIEIKCYPRKAAYQRIAFLVELTEGLQFACDELIDKGAIHTGA
jgi:hypothetical protein